MKGSIVYQDNGEYPDPEEIKITRGVYRIEGRISDFTPDEVTQYLDFDAAFEHEGELKRLHFNKLDVLSDGSFVAEVDVIDNWFPLAFFGYVIVSTMGLGALAVVINQVRKMFAEGKEGMVATALSLQWVAVIFVAIIAFNVIRL